MNWQSWIIVGLILLGLEVFNPTGFVLFIIGLAAVLTGLILFTGITLPTWAPWALCAVLIIVLLIFRRSIMRLFRADRSDHGESGAGETVTVSGDLAPGAVGQGEFRGTMWKVRNIGDRSIPKGTPCKVMRLDGFTVETRIDS